jgi:hypothetical protein
MRLSAAHEGMSHLFSLLVCWFSSCFSLSGAGWLLGWYEMRLSMMYEVVCATGPFHWLW